MRKILISFAKISGFFLFVGLIVRIVLILSPVTDSHFTLSDYLKIFMLGAINDFCVSVIAFAFFWLHLVFLSDSKYKSPWGYIILLLLMSTLIYLFCFKNIFDDYGSAAPLIVKSFIGVKTLSFALLLFFPKIRVNWRYSMFCFIFFLYVFLIIYNAISEFLFWEEFGVRYNFIAVDYLIYTNEVIGNIMESYPIIPMLSMLLLVSVIVTIFFVKKSKNKFISFPSFKVKLLSTVLYAGLIVGAIFLLKFNERYEDSDNGFVNELQANGLFRFYKAYMDSSLNYEKFYAKMPINEAFTLIDKEYSTSFKRGKLIKDSLPELRKNVVLVTIESMSGNFLKHSGNKENLTPNLDKLVNEGIFFENLYATGNRTVRGLEAVTLGIPPSPGESLVKRKDNGDMFSTGYLFKQRGYSVQYFYGGYGYFDNMKTFFEGNGYEVVDKKAFKSNEISFSNIWGVCDEDMFNKAIKTFDNNAKTGKPFFGHIMTVSNHRPFTYPEGRIDIPSSSKSRSGGVKYTDYAIGKFIEEAKNHSWFSNTVFIFVADHCASSAGKVDIPLEKYHIPAIIYAPGFVAPEKVTTLTSQIDIMPTLLGLLHFSYNSYFYGQNIKSPDYKPRAFMATYQKLGYLKDNTLIVLSPNQEIEQYHVLKNNELVKSKEVNKVISDEAIANYQTASYLIENKILKVKK